MKKLIALSGPAGRAKLELWEEEGVTRARLTPAVPGELWLAGGDGRLFRPDGAGRCPFEPAGALLLQEGRIRLHGGFAGRSALLERARQALLLRPGGEGVAAPAPAPAPSPAHAEQTTPPQPAPKPQSAALMEILSKAQELFSPLQQAPAPEPPHQRGQPALNPFPEAFPLSRWRRIPYPGTDSYYLEGELYRNRTAYIIHALPGEYRPGSKPRGFSRYLRGRDGSGYWVKIERQQGRGT